MGVPVHVKWAPMEGHR